MVGSLNPKETTKNGEEESLDEKSLQKELMEVFMIEFDELIEVYKSALKEIRKPSGDLKHAYFEIFRVFHTLKGDSGYFEEFEGFTTYSKEMCEQFRDLPTDRLKDPYLLRSARINFSRISSAFSALNRGKSLKAFRFKVFLKNF